MTDYTRAQIAHAVAYEVHALKALPRNRGITVKALADAAGVSKATMDRMLSYESEGKPTFDAVQLHYVATLLGDTSQALIARAMTSLDTGKVE